MSPTAEVVPASRWRSLALVALLGAAMVTSTLLQGSLGVLSSFILEEFDITRSVFGIAFAAYSLVGGLSSLYIGSLADRNSRAVIIWLFVIAGVGIGGAALAPSYVLLIAAVLVGGLALGAGNPATNRIIAERVPVPRRGLVIGIKQAGPPLGIFVAGILLPSIAVVSGWRMSLMVVAVLPAIGLIAALYIVPSGSRRAGAAPARVGDLGETTRFVVRWLTLIGFAIAVTNSAAIAWLPLFAQEDLAMTPTAAGVIAAAMGLAGVVGRIGWGAFGGRFRRPSTALILIALFSMLAFACMALSGALGAAWLWVGAIVGGVSMLSWHAVAWLVILDRVELSSIGRASGIMHMGSTLGFAAGAPLAGLILDLSDSYTLTWALLTLLTALVTLATTQFRSRGARLREKQSPVEPPGA